MHMGTALTAVIFTRICKQCLFKITGIHEYLAHIAIIRFICREHLSVECQIQAQAQVVTILYKFKNIPSHLLPKMKFETFIL